MIIPFPRVIWAWQSLAVLADYVSSLRGINNYVNLQGIGSMSTLLWLDSVISLFTTLQILFIFSSSFLCDLGVKIPIGRGELCKTLTRH